MPIGRFGKVTVVGALVEGFTTTVGELPLASGYGVLRSVLVNLITRDCVLLGILRVGFGHMIVMVARPVVRDWEVSVLPPPPQPFSQTSIRLNSMMIRFMVSYLLYYWMLMLVFVACCSVSVIDCCVFSASMAVIVTVSLLALMLFGAVYVTD